MEAILTDTPDPRSVGSRGSPAAAIVRVQPRFDPCYHAACDTIANLSAHALALNADAVAYAMYLYASGREAINLN
jgi:hypothetical protein